MLGQAERAVSVSEADMYVRGEHRRPHIYPHRYSQHGRGGEHRRLRVYPHRYSQNRGRGEHRRPRIYPHRNSQNRALAENIGDPVSTLTGTVGMGQGEHRRPCVTLKGTVRTGVGGEHRIPHVTLTGTVRTGGREKTGDPVSNLTGTVGTGWGEHRPSSFPSCSSRHGSKDSSSEHSLLDKASATILGDSMQVSDNATLLSCQK